MYIRLSEEEIRTLVRGNVERTKRERLHRYAPLVYPYTFWVEEDESGESYHCAYCGYKTDVKLEECPICDSEVVFGLRYKDMEKYRREIRYCY